MSYPWQGRAIRVTDADFARAAEELGCEPAVIKAVWQVESAGRPFRRDRTLERRYEPHHMPGSGVTNWRVSLRMSFSDREAAFMQAYRRNPEAALKATSAGGPQIMGFNHREAGYHSADAMFRAMADSEAEQLEAFVTLATAWGMRTYFVAKDWRSIARRWNGSGQVDEYARRMEAAYRSITGRGTPVVLRAGSSDRAAVRKLQQLLGIADDGIFGKNTDIAVRDFQQANGLAADGVVGAKTWEALERRIASSPAAPVGFMPPQKPDQVDYASTITGYAGAATAVGGAVATLGDTIPDEAMTILMGGAVAAGVISLCAFLFVKIRRAV